MVGARDAVLTGLTPEEAVRRLTAEGPNELPVAKPRNLLQQAWGVVREPMLLLLVGAGTVNFLLAEPLDGVILMSFVVVVIAHLDLPGAQDRERARRAPRPLLAARARRP